MTGITKAPARAALGSTLRAGVVVMFGLAWVAGVGWLASRGLTLTVPDTKPTGPGYWTTDGEGDDTTIGFEAQRTGFHLISWDAECPVRMTLHRWDGEEVAASYALGSARHASVPYFLRRGGYFFDGAADCEWTVSVR